jgi:hypothetical protein
MNADLVEVNLVDEYSTIDKRNRAAGIFMEYGECKRMICCGALWRILTGYSISRCVEQDFR